MHGEMKADTASISSRVPVASRTRLPESPTRLKELKREALLGMLVLVLSRATLEELAAVYRFATGERLPEPQQGSPGPLPGRAVAEGSSPVGAESGAAYVFRWTGRDWEVVFGGGRAFHLPNTLGGAVSQPFSTWPA